MPLRLDPAVYDALARWAADDLRSVNAQIEVLLRDALRGAGRLPAAVRPIATRARSAEDPERGPLRTGEDGTDAAGPRGAASSP